MEGLSREVCLSRIVLTSFAGAYQLGGIGTGSGPPNIFARDLHKPLVDYASVAQEGPPVEPTTGPEAPSVTETPAAEPKAMEIDAEPPQAD